MWEKTVKENRKAAREQQKRGVNQEEMGVKKRKLKREGEGGAQPKAMAKGWEGES